MSNISRKQKNDKVSHSGNFSATDILQIVRGDIKFGYKRILIDIKENGTTITKSKLGVHQ